MLTDILYALFFIVMGSILLYVKSRPIKPDRKNQKAPAARTLGLAGYGGAIFLAYGVYLVIELLIRLRQ